MQRGARAAGAPTAKYLTYRSLAAGMGHAPEPLARAVAGGVARALAWRGGPAQEMHRRHLRRVLASECPDGAQPDDALVRRLSRRGVLEYGRYWLDGARLPSTTPERVCGRMVIAAESETRLRQAMAGGRGVVMALPHMGSWEWGAAWLALEDMPMTAVVERVEPAPLFEWLVEQRRRMGLTVMALDQGRTGSELLRTLKAGGVVGLVSDRDLMGNGVEVEFFGERTTLPAGAATLALRTGAVLLPVIVYSGPGTWHTGVVEPAIDTTRRGTLRSDVARITQELAATFEHLIVARPEQWHLFVPNWPSDRVGAVTREGGDPVKAVTP